MNRSVNNNFCATGSFPLFRARFFTLNEPVTDKKIALRQKVGSDALLVSGLVSFRYFIQAEHCVDAVCCRGKTLDRQPSLEMTWSKMKAKPQGASSATVLSDARRRAYRGNRRSAEFHSAFSGGHLVSGRSRYRTLGGADHSASPRLVLQPLLRLRVERSVFGRLSFRQALELAA